MSLFIEWENLATNQTDESFESFWEEYCDAEIKLYTAVLEDGSGKFTGKFNDLASKYQVSPVLFTGFLDGIKTSLNNDFDVASVTETSDIDLDINFEKLFFNMLKADAEHLFTLQPWENILSGDQMKTIISDFKKTKTIIKDKVPGRNEPCSCGSGKKYKKCCGK